MRTDTCAAAGCNLDETFNLTCSCNEFSTHFRSLLSFNLSLSLLLLDFARLILFQLSFDRRQAFWHSLPRTRAHLFLSLSLSWNWWSEKSGGERLGGRYFKTEKARRCVMKTRRSRRCRREGEEEDLNVYLESWSLKVTGIGYIKGIVEKLIFREYIFMRVWNVELEEVEICVGVGSIFIEKRSTLFRGRVKTMPHTTL